MPTRTIILLFLATIFLSWNAAASEMESRELITKELEKPVVRGAIVFKFYCKLCHGHKADGIARAAKLHGVDNLNISLQSAEYYTKIIRKGGISVDKSPFMPMWEDELSAEQISDVVAYLKVVWNARGRGEVVFKTNCILCHGIKGDGKGRASVLYDPPPSDLRRSRKNNNYKRMIITNGGEAMGRNPGMPVWGDQLTKSEIEDVIVYIDSLLELR